MDGLLLVNKPAGLTSHDVVAKLRKIAKTKKVGHTGTLDPDATGLLPITIGYCTKLAQYLILDEKTYAFELKLGEQTDTDDDSGQVIAQAAWDHIEPAQIEALLPQFTGEIMQRPPKFSALRVNGKRAYDLARQGVEFELPERPVTVYSLVIDEIALPRVKMTMRCSSGTYVRSLARDIGHALQSCATTTMIERVSVGPFSLDQAVTLEELHGPEDVEAKLLSGAQMMAMLPSEVLDEHGLEEVAFGKPIVPKATYPAEATVALLDPQGQLIAIAQSVTIEHNRRVLQPKKVLIGAR